MKKYFFLCILFFLSVFGKKTTTTVCLNMIVKNETKVIRRCLDSVKPLIDYWVIVDTGSTDGTQKMIQEHMKNIPGKLYEEPWQNFSYNRNHALKLAKGKADYILFIDADEELIYEKEFTLPLLKHDFYYITSVFAGSRYVRTQLVKDSLDWYWEGVVHELILCKQANTCATLKGIHNLIRPEGFRSEDPYKYHKDAALLEKELIKNPNNTRSVFYLAQSYRDAGELNKSLMNYKKRVQLGGWDQEVFWSLYQIGLLQQSLQKDPSLYTQSFYEAFTYRPRRAEPLYHLASHYRMQKKYHKAFTIAGLGLKIPIPEDILFVENWIYEWGLLMEYSVSAYWIKNYGEALKASLRLLENKNLPPNVKDRVEKNLEWIQLELQKKAS